MPLKEFTVGHTEVIRKTFRSICKPSLKLDFNSLSWYNVSVVVVVRSLHESSNSDASLVSLRSHVKNYQSMKDMLIGPTRPQGHKGKSFDNGSFKNLQKNLGS